MILPSRASRVRAEAALLEAVAEDDPTKVSSALGLTHKYAGELLALKVRATYNNASDGSAFFHSIASYGLQFQLGENITELAKRNGMTEALKILETVEKRLVPLTVPLGRPLETEALLLKAISADDGAEITKLASSVNARQVSRILSLKVKDSYNDANDSTAFYHSVASHSLKFQLGDTLLDLAVRNEKPSAVESLKKLLGYEVSSEMQQSTKESSKESSKVIKAFVRNAMSGEELCQISAESSWTIARLVEEVARVAPAAGGCRIFLLGESAVMAGTTLADLTEGDTLELSSLVRENVSGVYFTTIAGDGGLDDPLGPLGGPGGRLLPGGRRPKPAELRLELCEDGTALVEYSAKPIDRGHCAPPSGGHFISASGTWTFAAPGVKVDLTKGFHGHFIRMIPTRASKWEQEQSISLAMAKEDQFDVVDVVCRSSRSSPETVSLRSPHVLCPKGAAFVKTEGRRRLLKNFRMDEEFD